MPSIVSVQHFSSDLGLAAVSGILFVTEPFEESFIQGTLTIEGITRGPLFALIRSPVNVTVPGPLGECISVTIRFDIPTKEVLAAVEAAGSAKRAIARPDWRPIASLR